MSTNCVGLRPELSVASTARVYLYMQAVDMRCSYNGLHAIVESEFKRDIRLGDYFMFINCRRDRIKIIWWDRDGLAIFIKKQKAEDTHFDIFVVVGSRDMAMDRLMQAIALCIDVRRMTSHHRQQARLRRLTCSSLVEYAFPGSFPDRDPKGWIMSQSINIILSGIAHCHRIDSLTQEIAKRIADSG